MEYLKLNNDVEMPIEGLGTFLMTPAEAEAAATAALAAGYEHIDTANAYMNERAVGRAIAKSGIARDKIFVSTKLWPSVYDAGMPAVDATLQRLGLDYVALAEKYGKTPAQVILRWHVQMGTSIIPGSKNPAHIADNANIFDFSLTEDEMAEIAKLDGTMTYYTATEEALAGYLAIRPDFDAQE